MVIDMEATPEPKQKSRSVDSLVGGQKSDVIQEQPKVEEPVVQQSNEPEWEAMPPAWETMPITELVPEQKYDPNHVLNEWNAKIEACNEMAELISLMNEMPTHYKQNACKAALAKRNAELKAMAEVPEPKSIVNFDEWKNKITKCNSRKEFTALQKEMPPVVFNNDDIKKFMKTRESFCMQNYPDIW
jgi:hypothetical protein